MRLLAVLLFISFSSYSQNALRIRVVDAANNETLPGANIVFDNQAQSGNSTNRDGIAIFTDLTAGQHQVTVSFVGYQDTTVAVVIPFRGSELVVRLTSEEEELEEVVISSTRTNTRIENLPLKVEVLGQEEMDEESTLVPGNISSLLGDLAVITVQRTNPLNGNDAIRMQGLDAQYTLITRDGLPLYGGFSGSLGVLAIPPLDLKQVEIIKGSVSTLYGGGAIAGMINFLSKQPTEKTHGALLFNGTGLKEKNINAFLSGKASSKTGYTIFAGANLKAAFDVNDDGFSEVPKHHNYTIHPRLFFELSEKSKLNIGLTTTIDNRRTGDMIAVEDEQTVDHPYLRTEKTLRNVLDVQYDHAWKPTQLFSFKTAASIYSRELTVPARFVPNFSFDGTQYSVYSEAMNRSTFKKHTVVYGGNIIAESLRKNPDDSVAFGNYDFTTLGIFIQDDWQLTEKFSIETGFRLDNHNAKGLFPLPRIALFYKANKNLSFRLASGAGYKTPNILALVDPNPTLINNFSSVKSERSFGANADINYNVLLFDELEVSLNQAFYYGKIANTLRVITDTLSRTSYMENQQYTARTYGTDSYVQMVFRNFELYVGYNHTEAYQDKDGERNPMPFNPKNKFSTTLAYSIVGKWRMGIEASYSANQYIYNSMYYYNSQTIYPSTRVPNFWFWAAMIERKFKFGSIVVNVENLFDARQSKFGPLYDGPITAPSFRPIWAPLDGRVANLSLKINL